MPVDLVHTQGNDCKCNYSTALDGSDMDGVICAEHYQEKLKESFTLGKAAGREEECMWWAGNIRLHNGEGVHAKDKSLDEILEDRKGLEDEEVTPQAEQKRSE